MSYKFLKSPEGFLNNHILSVDVYSSDDGGPSAPLGFCITGSKDGTVSCSPQTKRDNILGRFRGEPAVKITLIEENGDGIIWYLYIYHHKGTIHLEKHSKMGGPSALTYSEEHYI